MKESEMSHSWSCLSCYSGNDDDGGDDGDRISFDCRVQILNLLPRA